MTDQHGMDRLSFDLPIDVATATLSPEAFEFWGGVMHAEMKAPQGCGEKLAEALGLRIDERIVL